MRARKKGKSIFKIIIVILLSAILLGSLTYIIKNFDEITENVGNIFNNNNLSIDYQGETISGRATDLRFTPGEDNELALNNAQDYTIRITPAAGVDFDFIVDSNYYSFAAENDFTTCFDITENEYSIVINSSFTMDEILQNKYPGSKLEFIADFEDIDYFTLTIESAGETIALDFGCNLAVSGVELQEALVVYLWENL